MRLMLGDPARAPPEFLVMQTASQPETQGDGQWPIEMYRPIVVLPITHLGCGVDHLATPHR